MVPPRPVEVYSKQCGPMHAVELYLTGATLCSFLPLVLFCLTAGFCTKQVSSFLPLSIFYLPPQQSCFLSPIPSLLLSILLGRKLGFVRPLYTCNTRDLINKKSSSSGATPPPLIPSSFFPPFSALQWLVWLTRQYRQPQCFSHTRRFMVMVNSLDGCRLISRQLTWGRTTFT